jgi:hypothetical protein
MLRVHQYKEAFMKKLQFLGVLAMALVLSFSVIGCKTDDDPAPGFTLDLTQFYGTYTTVTPNGNGTIATLSANSLIISGGVSKTEAISLESAGFADDGTGWLDGIVTIKNAIVYLRRHVTTL